MHQLVVAVLAFLPLLSFSQLQITGKVVNRQDKLPIAYVNIGVINSTVGTISSSSGTFTLTVSPDHRKDTLVFSALGHSKISIPVSYFENRHNVVVQLSEQTTTLQTATVTGKRERKKTYKLGNKFSKGGHIYGDTIAAGAAMALLIENKYPAYHAGLTFPVYVENASLRISKNTLDEFKVRVRLMDVDSLTGLPGRDLLEESIVITSRIKKGWIRFVLSGHPVRINKPAFFLAFEWILEDEERIDIVNQYMEYRRIEPRKVTVDTVVVEGKKLTFHSWHGFMTGTSFSVSSIPFSLNQYKSYYRNNSLGEWKRASAILTARIEVSNQPTTNAGLTAVPKEASPCAANDPVCNSVRLVEDFINEHEIQGIQLAVSTKGRLVLSKGFGWADVDRGIPVTNNTRFRIGSISKSLTSAALVKLVADKKLDLDAPVENYVPSFPKKPYPITTRQLAGHLAGIRHYREEDNSDFTRTEHYATATKALAVFAADPLLFKPGTSYYYSSFGWNLVGAVIEGASGESYLSYMVKNIWLPLGMTSTYGDVADSVMANRSKQYDYTGEAAQFEDLSYKYPSGGLISRAEDLVKYGNQLLHGNYLDPSLVTMLFESQQTSDEIPTNYGLGWNVGKDKNGHRIWFHAGHLLNGSAFLMLYPDDDIVIAFLANGQEGLSFDVQRVGEFFYK